MTRLEVSTLQGAGFLFELFQQPTCNKKIRIRAAFVQEIENLQLKTPPTPSAISLIPIFQQPSSNEKLPIRVAVCGVTKWQLGGTSAGEIASLPDGDFYHNFPTSVPFIGKIVYARGGFSV